MRKVGVLAVLFAVSCGPMGMAELDLAVIPRTIPDDGTEAVVRVTATTAKGEIGRGTVRVSSTIGSLKDGETLTLDTFGTAKTVFTCNRATEPACAGTVTFSATWVVEKNEVLSEANAQVMSSTPMGGGTGGGGGGPPPFPTPPCPTAQGRVYLYEGTEMSVPVVDEPMDRSLQFNCTTGGCNFMEFTGGGRIEPLILLSLAAPTGTDLTTDSLFTTGMVGNGSVYRLQWASLMRDCSASPGHQFRLEQFVPGSTNQTTHGIVRFRCTPMNAMSPPIVGCGTF